MWSGTGKLLSMGANFIITMVLAHALAPTEYGAYFVALTSIIIVASIGTMGMDQVVVRFTAIYTGENNYIGAGGVIGRCLGVVFLGAVATCVGFFLLGSIFFRRVLDMPDLVIHIGILSVWLFFATLQRQLAETFRGLNDIRLATLFGGVRSSGIINALLACVGILILWISNCLNIFTVLLTMLGASVVVVVLAVLTLAWHLRCRNKYVEEKIGLQRAEFTVKGALHEGWPLWLAVLATVINNMGGAWLASGLDTSAHVALYGVAQRFMFLLIAPVVILNAVMPPVISQLHSTGQTKRLEQIVRSVSGLLLIPATALFVVLLFSGESLLHVLFGTYYENAYSILILLCVGQVVSVASGAWQVVLPMTGGRHQMLSSSAIALFVQFAAGLLLGYQFGVVGVAAGYCLSSTITNIIGVIFVYKKLGIWTFSLINLYTIKMAKDVVITKFIHHVGWQRS